MILLSSFGTGSEFIVKFASKGQLVSIGATGTYITLTPPSGQRVRLSGLAGASTQTNLTTITVGGSDVVTDALLLSTNDNSMGADNFKIGYGLNNEITGDVNEVIEITTNVATSSSTNYHYQFGV